MEVAIKRHRTVYLLLTFALLVALGLSGCQRGSANPPTLEPTAVSAESANTARPDPTNSPAPVPTAVPTLSANTARPDPTNSPAPVPPDTSTSVADPSTSPKPSEKATPVANGVYFPCDAHLVDPTSDMLRTFTFIEWTPDGSRLIFNEGIREPGIMIASADGPVFAPSLMQPLTATGCPMDITQTSHRTAHNLSIPHANSPLKYLTPCSLGKNGITTKSPPLALTEASQND